MDSINSGYPLLMDIAMQESVEAVDQLDPHEVRRDQAPASRVMAPRLCIGAVTTA